MSQSYLNTQIESISKSLPSGAQEDFRQLMTTVIDQVTSISPGNSWLRAGGTQKNSASTPKGVSLSVSAANGVFTLSVKWDSQNSSNPVPLFEVSFSTVKGFTSGVTTLQASPSTTVTLSLPGTTYYFRVRASYDGVNWSSYSLASTTASSSGLVSSTVTAEGATFNQTNYMNVDSVAVGSTANIRVYGTSGVLRSGTRVKGGVQSTLPSATIANVTPATKHFVAWDATQRQYVLRNSLADVLADNLAPVGAVDVVATGTPRLPTVVAIRSSSGGAIIAYNVIDGGAGATADYTFTITDSTGTGATTGQQTFHSGVLVSVAPGNPGQNYSSAVAVTPSGGTSAGSPGGGTAAGGNGGRLTAV